MSKGDVLVAPEPDVNRSEAERIVDGAPKRPLHRRLSRSLPDETGVLVALVVLVGVVGFFKPAFAAPGNLVDLLTGTTFFGILALGTVFLLAMGEVDLSIGWMFNFAAVIGASAMKAGLDPYLGVLVCVLAGAVMGLANGLLARWFNVGLIIVSLGTASVYQGLSLVVGDQRAVIPPQRDTSSYFRFMQYEIADLVPVLALIFVALAIVLDIIFDRSVFGFRVRSIGSNVEAAQYAGLPVVKTRLQAATLNGALCGFSGALFIGFREAVDPLTGSTFTLTAIAAAIIGGTALTGGGGTVVGALLGSLIITVIGSAIIFFGVQVSWSTFVTGAVILGAVGVDQLVRNQRRRAERADSEAAATTT